MEGNVERLFWSLSYLIQFQDLSCFQWKRERERETSFKSEEEFDKWCKIEGRWMAPATLLIWWSFCLKENLEKDKDKFQQKREVNFEKSHKKR